MEISHLLAELHPRLVPFPIVLLLTALLLDGAGLLWRNERAHDTAKWMMVVAQLLQSPVKSLRCMTGEHRSLVPDAQHVLSSENVA